MAESYVIRLLQRIGAAAFSKDDNFARAQGWEVRRSRLGLSRSYRHPGFDQLASCPMCRGTGAVSEAACSLCSGAGRVRLRSQTLADRGH